MGKAVPRQIKIRAEFLLQQFPKRFTQDFEHNKAALASFQLPFSKTDRNLMAGFITRKVNEQAQA